MLRKGVLGLGRQRCLLRVLGPGGDGDGGDCRTTHHGLARKSSSGSAPAENSGPEKASSSSWSDHWRKIGLGADKADEQQDKLNRLMFVQAGFGCDQHGNRDGEGATQAAIRACRNAIEFNSIPGMIEAVPGGRKNMLVHVKLGVPPGLAVDLDKVAMVFPYGSLLPVEVVTGGISYGCGRVVPELGDEDDTAIIVCAVVSIGYHDRATANAGEGHRVWDTRDGH